MVPKYQVRRLTFSGLSCGKFFFLYIRRTHSFGKILFPSFW
nr:unnamed protein product [Callosobruchus chinensis]